LARKKDAEVVVWIWFPDGQTMAMAGRISLERFERLCVNRRSA
jgi:hypothetical protein